MFNQVKRQRIQQQLRPPASINKFVWTGDEDNSEEIERLTLHLKALIGWDDFPSDMELRDVHTQTLFDVRLEDESNRVEITGEGVLSTKKYSSCSEQSHTRVQSICLLLKIWQL